MENITPSVGDWKRIERGVSRISEHYGYARFRKFKTPRTSRQNENFSYAIFTAFYLFSIMSVPTRFDRLNIEINDRILERLRIYFVLAILKQSVLTPLNDLETIEITKHLFFDGFQSLENIETKYSSVEFQTFQFNTNSCPWLSFNQIKRWSKYFLCEIIYWIIIITVRKLCQVSYKIKPPRAAKAHK